MSFDNLALILWIVAIVVIIGLGILHFVSDSPCIENINYYWMSWGNRYDTGTTNLEKARQIAGDKPIFVPKCK